MPTTYTPLATTTLGSATATVTFSSIPQTYTDLIIAMSLPSVGGGNNGDGLRFQINGDTATNYSATYISNSGSTAGSTKESSQTRGRVGFVTQTTGNIGSAIAHFQNYSNTSTYKSVIGRCGNLNTNADAQVFAGVSTWRSTAAINQIVFSLSSNSNFVAGTTFSVYGVASAAVVAQGAKATGGDIISTDGSYWYHTFLSSGSFTPTQALTADYLVVAGGGGASGGGGGAGGMRCTVGATGGGGSLESALSLTAQAYTVTIGAGGAGGVNTSASASSGSNSVFSTITSTGGGYGAGGGNGSATNGGNGGSGGGAFAYNNTSTPTGGTRQTGQGFVGGNVTNGVSVNAAGGAGGGAGAAGNAAVGGLDGGAPSYQNGQKAAGVATTISGSSFTYGIGGRGYFATSGTAIDGRANSGDGGDAPGSGGGQTGKQGGSGIVIVRYAV